jgi:hypothetical protein
MVPRPQPMFPGYLPDICSTPALLAAVLIIHRESKYLRSKADILCTTVTATLITNVGNGSTTATAHSATSRACTNHLTTSKVGTIPAQESATQLHAVMPALPPLL